MPELSGTRLEVVDVADDSELYERYLEAVPVLRVGGVELSWPFEPAEVLATMSRVGEPE